MQIITLQDFLYNIDFFIKEALDGKIFVYPTDTIYGIGACFPDGLEKIYNIKQRDYSKKVSVIFPGNIDDLLNSNVFNSSIDKIKLKSVLTDIWNKNRGWTLIGRLSDRYYDLFSKNLLFSKIYKDKTLGIRILNHSFQKFINKLGKLFITTSANISGEQVIKSISDLPIEIKNNIDYIVDGGVLDNLPSILVDIINGDINIVERT